jgi:serine/threonine-protein kinase
MKCQVCGHENVDEARFCASCGAAIPTRSLSDQDPLIGQVIGNRYRITGVIGEGGMGVVYVGEQQMGSTIRKVAVKTLHPHLSKDENVLKRFHRECGTVAQLEHPNTIKVYDFGSTPDGTLYIAMEFVAGRALSDVLEKEHKLSGERVTQVLRQVCGALDEAHGLGIVHRDLKPDNIILTQRAGEQDFVKVLDFGIAARTESADAAREQKLTQQGTVLGTPPYMSPEQFTGKALDRRSDIYSLGVMAYEMLTGKLPFEADTPWQWATQHMTAQPLPFDVVAPSLNVPAPMKDAILRALSKDREQRQATAGQFISELSQGAGAATKASPVVAAPSPYQPTAAMPEMPNFAAAPAGAPARTATVATNAAAPAAAPAMSAVPVIAAPPKGKGGKSGLTIALIGGGIAIAAIGVVFAVRSKPADDPSAASASASTAPMAPASIAPEVATVAAATSTPEITPPDPVQPREVSGGRKPPPKATTATHTSVATHTATAATNTGTTASQTTQPTTPVTPTPVSNPACAACISAANGGDIAGAAAQYARCSDPSEKAKCTNAATRGAQQGVKGAIAQHDCNRARAIAQAARSMGLLNAAALENAAAKCQ